MAHVFRVRLDANGASARAVEDEMIRWSKGLYDLAGWGSIEASLDHCVLEVNDNEPPGCEFRWKGRATVTVPLPLQMSVNMTATEVQDQMASNG